MSKKGRRRLRPEEEALWKEVARRTRPLHSERPSQAPIVTPKPDPEPPTLPQPITPFRVGERAGHAVSSIAATAPQPPSMDKKTFGRMRRGKLQPEGRIDLHGMTLAQAHPALIRFMMSSQAAGKRLVLVITGKGKPGSDDTPIPSQRGILRRQVPQWLRLPPLSAIVLQVSEAHLKHGGGGAFYVYLRRLR